MGRTASKAADTAAVSSTTASNLAEVDTSAQDADVQKALEDAETRAADAEQARAEAESRAACAEAALQEATEAAAASSAYADYGEIPAVVASLMDLNLRSGPGLEYGVLDILPDGSAVTVCPLPYDAEVPGWALVVTASGTMGWVMTEFLAEPPGEV